MIDGIMDIHADLLKDAIKGTTDHIHSMFKDKKPFRQEPVDPRQRVLEFEAMPDEVRQFAIQNYPDQYTKLSQSIEKLRKRTEVRNA